MSMYARVALSMACATNVVTSFGAAQTPSEPPVGPTAFVNVTVVPMNSERVLPRQTVVVKSGRITALGPVGGTPVPNNAARVDGQGKFLIPGLADMHAHLTTFRLLEDLVGPVPLWKKHRLFLLLAHGLTTVRILDRGNGSHSTLYGPGTNKKDALVLRARVAAGTLLGPGFIRPETLPENLLLRTALLPSS